MKKNIKNYSVEFILPILTDVPDESVTIALMDWVKLFNSVPNHEEIIYEDEWTILPYLPQYKFKNLRIVSDIAPTDITLKFDDVIKNEYEK